MFKALASIGIVFDDCRILWEALTRIWFSLLEQDVLMLLTFIVGIIATPNLGLDGTLPYLHNITRRKALFIAACVFIFVRLLREYAKRNDDVTMALKKEEKFREIRPERVEASSFLLECLQGTKTLSNETAPVSLDEVLDELEDIGFHRRAGHISTKVAHHYFHYWIDGYYLLCKAYIQERRLLKPHEWEHIQELFEITSKYESAGGKKETSKGGAAEDRAEVIKFLKGEMRSRNGKS